MIELSASVQATLSTLGDAGRRWHAALDGLLAELAADWDITLGPTLVGGSFAYVAEATMADGTPAVLKVSIPHDFSGNGTFAAELRTMRAAAGRGCVEVLEADESRRAYLMERLGPRVNELPLSLSEKLAIICRTVSQLWAPVEPDGGGDWLTLAEKGPWLADSIEQWWDELDRPCSEAAATTAGDARRPRGLGPGLPPGRRRLGGRRVSRLTPRFFEAICGLSPHGAPQNRRAAATAQT